MGLPNMQLPLLVTGLLWAATGEDAIKCPGQLNMVGVGPVSVIAAKWNVPGTKTQKVNVEGNNVIIPEMGGRAYFADTCAEGPYNSAVYKAIPLLGKTLRYTTDVSGAGCGCNSALYLVAMHQNMEESACQDFYCDANKVCGVRCAEIDIQEANEVSWYSTLHVFDDGKGVGGGYGAFHHDWSSREYGPGAKCIDTKQPFQVAVSFPTGYDGTLAAMEVELTQGGKCPLKTLVHRYQFGGRNGLAELSSALAEGMTPVVSYWASHHLEWMDGVGDGQGPCHRERPSKCAPTTRFYAFSVDAYTGTYHGEDSLSPVVPMFPGVPAQPQVVPPPWVPAKDATGRTYYWNTVTGTTAWTIPIYT